MSADFEYLPFEILLLYFSVLFYFQTGTVMAAAANRLQGASLASVHYYFKWQILKICGQIGKTKMLSCIVLAELANTIPDFI